MNRLIKTIILGREHIANRHAREGQLAILLTTARAMLIFAACALSLADAAGQALGEPDRSQPGDAAIQKFLASQAHEIDEQFLVGIDTKESFLAARERLRREYFDMLGLWPVPERTPLNAKVTGVIQGADYVVEKLHYQSRPHLYVTGNLYRPAKLRSGERLPAVLYVCGHASEGRNGGKTAFQSHGLWLARHGYVCLIVDTLQLGEIGATHHGTYREGRWWWHSRGYTPAGVECWNGVRGIDYLVSRPDVDPQRIGVTGISGGGAATFWIAAADQRVRVAVPVSGMSDLTSYVGNRVINGHCDCMFLYNHHRWPWTQIAAMIAPRPLLFANSDEDSIFPMDGNRRISARLEKLYTLLGAPELFASFVSHGGHAYRQDLRQAIFQFLNRHLKDDSSPVNDSEVDVPDGKNYAIAPEKLRVFATDADLPADQLNTTIDEVFVPIAKVELPTKENFVRWKQKLRERLVATSLRSFHKRIDPAMIDADDPRGSRRIITESAVECQLIDVRRVDRPARLVLVVSLDNSTDAQQVSKTIEAPDNSSVYLLQPRGVALSQWTQKNPPNYVERSFALLGRTVDEGRILDIIAAARRLRMKHPDIPIQLAGAGAAAVLCAYAALIEPDIAEVLAIDPMPTHTDSRAAQLLSVLRVCDVPEVFGMLAPKSLTIRLAENSSDATVAEQRRNLLARVRQIYEAAKASDQLHVVSENQ